MYGLWYNMRYEKKGQNSTSFYTSLRTFMLIIIVSMVFHVAKLQKKNAGACTPNNECLIFSEAEHKYCQYGSLGEKL